MELTYKINSGRDENGKCYYQFRDHKVYFEEVHVKNYVDNQNNYRAQQRAWKEISKYRTEYCSKENKQQWKTCQF